MLQKLCKLDLPFSVKEWTASFLSERSHKTSFDGQTSMSKGINSSVVQGSALGPTAFIVVASDLKTIHPRNALIKFADDTYLIIPASNLQTTEEELEHVESWAVANNL
jgi:hypothetical protein